jgi:hypothetical protein
MQLLIGMEASNQADRFAQLIVFSPFTNYHTFNQNILNA